MKSSLSVLVLSAAVLVAAPVFAQHGHHQAPGTTERAAGAGKLVPITEKDAAWAAKAREAYPLQACLTSDEKLGSMGDSADFIYRVEGKPDRLVRFCCAGCDEDFMKDPAKYLAKIDGATKSNKGSGKKSGRSKSGGAHQHE